MEQFVQFENGLEASTTAIAHRNQPGSATWRTTEVGLKRSLISVDGRIQQFITDNQAFVF